MNVEYYAVSDTGWRAITGEGDLLQSETLHSGSQPIVPAADNAIKKHMLMNEANVAIGPLQDAVDLGMANDEETSLYNEWRKYRVLLSRVDITLQSPVWPEHPLL